MNVDFIHHLRFWNRRQQEFLNTWGIAFAPFGFKLAVPKWKAITPNARLLGGFVWFDKPFPDARGLNLNFTYELDLGLDWQIAEQLKFYTGYTFFHHSNAEIGRVNPGMDNNMFVMGLFYQFK